jgi:YD repeat-containing protein
MRTTLMTLFLALLLPAAALAQVTLEDQLLHGPVKTMIEEQELPDEYERRVMRELHFDEQGILMASLTTSYDYLDGSILSTDERNYNPATREIELLRKDASGELLGTGTNSYNEQGKLLEAVMHDADGNIQSRTAYGFDAAGNVIRLQAVFGGRGYSYEYDYDAAGNQTASRDYDGEGNLTARGVFTGEGRDYSGERFADGEPTGRLMTRANERDQLVHVLSTDADGDVEYESEYLFDENGLLVEEIFSYDGDWMITTYEYEFDAHGNWTRRTTTEDAFGYTFVSEVTYRTFTYY